MGVGVTVFAGVWALWNGGVGLTVFAGVWALCKGV